MVTTLTHRSIFMVKKIGQMVVFNFVDHTGDDLTVRKFYRFVLIRQGIDNDGFRYVFVSVCSGYEIPLAESPGRHHFFLILARNTDDLRFGNRVTVGTGGGALRQLFLKRDVAAGTGGLGLPGFVTPDTALIDIGPVHGLLQGDTTAFFGSLNGVTLHAAG